MGPRQQRGDSGCGVPSTDSNVHQNAATLAPLSNLAPLPFAMCCSPASFDVLCVGHAAWDLVFTVDAVITEDQKYRALDLAQSVGGPAANAACLLSQWGLSVVLASHVGGDAFGAAITRDLRQAGVDTAYLRHEATEATPISTIVVSRSTGSRTIINHRPDPRLSARRTELPDHAPRAMLCDGHEPGLTALALDLHPHALSILDAGSYRQQTHELAQRVDHAVVSAAFAHSATGILPDSPESAVRCVRALARAYPSRVAVTLGARGVVALDDDGEPVVLEPPRVRAVDTTAAGDIFHGAFTWALLNGRDYLPALRLAMRTAALSVTRPGGYDSIPSRDEARAFCPEWWPNEVPG